MPEEEESNRPKLIIPASEGDKSKNRLLVPQSDSETESASPKPQLAIDQSEKHSVGKNPAEETPAEETPAEETPAEETPAEETPAEETPAEETPAEETAQDSVNVVEMSPPVNEEGVIGQLPQPQEDDWMKDAYEQVADADRATEEMNESQGESHFDQSNVDQSAEPIYQAPAEPVYQAPAEPVHESPVIPPQVVAPPQMFAQQQPNPYQNVQPYQQSYYAPPVAGAYPYQQQGMPVNVPPNTQQVPVGQPRGIPGPAWLTIGLIVGVAVALLIFKYMPLDMASSFRPDLVDKGKALVKGAQNQTEAPVAPPVPDPQPEEAPSDPEEPTDSDVNSE